MKRDPQYCLLSLAALQSVIHVRLCSSHSPHDMVHYPPKKLLWISRMVSWLITTVPVKQCTYRE